MSGTITTPSSAIAKIAVQAKAMVFPEEFRPVCRYVMRDHRPQEFKVLDEQLWEHSGAVYARLYGNKVIYIGSTDGRLCKRSGVSMWLSAGVHSICLRREE